MRWYGTDFQWGAFAGTAMQIVRVYTGTDGESHFEDIDVEFDQSGAFGRISKMVAARGVLFREVDGDYDLDFHNAPRRQYVVTLSGESEVELDGGRKIRLGPGHILLAEDTTGQGHISRAVGGKPRKSLFITLD